MAKVLNLTYMRSSAAPFLSKRRWNHAFCRSNVSHNVTSGYTELYDWRPRDVVVCQTHTPAPRLATGYAVGLITAERGGAARAKGVR